VHVLSLSHPPPLLLLHSDHSQLLDVWLIRVLVWRSAIWGLRSGHQFVVLQVRGRLVLCMDGDLWFRVCDLLQMVDFGLHLCKSDVHIFVYEEHGGCTIQKLLLRWRRRLQWLQIFRFVFQIWRWLTKLWCNHGDYLGFLVKKMGREAHMASVLSRTEVEYGASASVETRGKKLTFLASS